MRLRWGVLIYKSDYDLDVTLVQPRDVDFRSRTIFIGLNFFAIRCARVKNIPFNFLVQWPLDLTSLKGLRNFGH